MAAASSRAVRGEYGAGETFFARWLAERAKRRGFAAAEVQGSELETPLRRVETVYRRLVEHLNTEQVRRQRATSRPRRLDLRDVLASGTVSDAGRDGLDRADQFADWDRRPAAPRTRRAVLARAPRRHPRPAGRSGRRVGRASHGHPVRVDAGGSENIEYQCTWSLPGGHLEHGESFWMPSDHLRGAPQVRLLDHHDVNQLLVPSGPE
ncbi:DUF2791 family P-loop domain-containing protein [Solwaraspora sp. WMMD937]|uniref:BREX system ATP-binding domain-containing protein n=1 Tax=Solwaraspora sp. WMMD937 TaxID=3016090 RepID=UPI00249C92CE|nr:BREX system ATP-binding domain-containing protein [Solwaraspora sp. WMMD937]WFE22207.1 DUF2791 family P-loop domain-containing protein [Solwaraspora sp. WMMD937]